MSNTNIHNNIQFVKCNKVIVILKTNIHNNIECVTSNKLIGISKINISNNIQCVNSNKLILFLILIFTITYNVSLEIS